MSITHNISPGASLPAGQEHELAQAVTEGKTLHLQCGSHHATVAVLPESHPRYHPDHPVEVTHDSQPTDWHRREKLSQTIMAASIWASECAEHLTENQFHETQPATTGGPHVRPHHPSSSITPKTSPGPRVRRRDAHHRPNRQPTPATPVAH